MEQLGLGVMISQLAGNRESSEAFTNSLNKTITELTLGADDALHFTFDDGSKIKILDEGQSCCEIRYMRTDDKISDYIGARLLGAEIKNAPCEGDEYGEHEIQFLEISTSKGCFTMANHNEHNGYYGGFSIKVSKEE